MAKYPKMIFIVCLVLIMCMAVSVLSQPPSVPRLTERTLDKASYVKLAKEWKKYIEQYGETANALVNLGMAYDYSEEQDAAVVAAKRAVELEPDNPKALEFLGKMLLVWVEDEEGAAEVLEHCREVAPDYEKGLTTLATLYMRQGDLEKSENVFKTVFDQRIIAHPLQDYAYNMLVGLPQGAVLITGGDNDTFPPLALQAGMDFRKDVIIINRPLLNVIGYAEGIFKRHPSIKPKYKIDKDAPHKVVDGEIHLLSNALIGKIIEERKVPVFFAASTNTAYFDFKPDLFVEGLNFRTTKKGLSAEESAKLFLETYRMDSATDWNFAWSLVPKVSKLLSNNYVASMIKLAEHEDITENRKQKLLEKALEIAKFHDLDKMSFYIESLQNK